MKRLALLALPVLALVAVASIAAAYPLLNTEDMTQEEKELRIQVLELRQEAINDQIAYLNGELTEEQLQERLQAHHDEMLALREQIMESFGNGEGCACGTGWGHRGPGRFMMGGW